MNKDFPLVSIITVNYNSKQFLKDCFDSLHSLDYPKNKLEIIMVDNNPQDGSALFVEKTFPGVRIIRNDSNNYCKANNLGIAKSKGEFIAIVNNDTIFDKRWLISLIEVINKNPKIGMVGSKIMLPDGKIQSTGHIEFPDYYWGDRGLMEEDKRQYDRIESVKSVSNCSALYRREALNKVGVFDEDFGMYMEDVDMAFRLKNKGWGVLYVPGSIVLHKLHGSNQDRMEMKFYIEKNRLLFIVKYFPDKLAESLYGNGEIIRLKIVDFHRILIAIHQKLIKHYGAKEADKIFSRLGDSLKMIGDYRLHCFNVELENKTHNLKQTLISLEEQVKVQSKEILSKDAQLQALDTQYRAQQQALQALEEQVKVQSKEILSKDAQLQALDTQYRAQQQASQALEEENKGKDTEIDGLKDLIKDRDVQIEIQKEDIEKKQRRILELSQEVLQIYESETYRFIVKPLIWPILSFVKNATNLFNHPHKSLPTLHKKYKRPRVSIAQFYSKSSVISLSGESEYYIKLVNNQFEEEKIKLVIDIWPYRNRSHPKRHFCYFAVEVMLKPRNMSIVKVAYDWDKNVKCLVDNNEQTIIDFWRGALNSSEFYAVYLTVLDLSSGILDESSIVQKK